LVEPLNVIKAGIFFGYLEKYFGHLVHCMVIGIFSGNLVYFSQFWYIVSRKIWQPWIRCRETLHRKCCPQKTCEAFFFCFENFIFSTYKQCTLSQLHISSQLHAFPENFIRWRDSNPGLLLHIFTWLV
jgi:hypothetical protein